MLSEPNHDVNQKLARPVNASLLRHVEASAQPPEDRAASFLQPSASSAPRPRSCLRSTGSSPVETAPGDRLDRIEQRTGKAVWPPGVPRATAGPNRDGSGPT